MTSLSNNENASLPSTSMESKPTKVAYLQAIDPNSTAPTMAPKEFDYLNLYAGSQYIIEPGCNACVHTGHRMVFDEPIHAYVKPKLYTRFMPHCFANGNIFNESGRLSITLSNISDEDVIIKKGDLIGELLLLRPISFKIRERYPRGKDQVVKRVDSAENEEDSGVNQRTFVNTSLAVNRECLMLQPTDQVDNTGNNVVQMVAPYEKTKKKWRLNEFIESDEQTLSSDAESGEDEKDEKDDVSSIETDSNTSMDDADSDFSLEEEETPNLIKHLRKRKPHLKEEFDDDDKFALERAGANNHYKRHRLQRPDIADPNFERSGMRRYVKSTSCQDEEEKTYDLTETIINKESVILEQHKDSNPPDEFLDDEDSNQIDYNKV